MRYIIAYDISSTRWRNRLVKILEYFGERIQYSVFECELTEAGVLELRAKLKVGEFLTGKHGAICVYPLDEISVRNIERYGQSVNVDKGSIIVT